MKKLIVLLALIMAATSVDAQMVFYRKRVKADTLNYAGALPIGAVRDSMRTYASRADTFCIYTFGAAGGNAGDTTVFTTSTYYGSFYNEGIDTLVITSLRCVMAHGIGTDTLTVNVSWDDSLGGTGAVALNTTPLAITSIGTGTEDVSFNNSKIPPNVWVWCKTPTVVAGRKPTYFSASLSGYKKR